MNGQAAYQEPHHSGLEAVVEAPQFRGDLDQGKELASQTYHYAPHHEHESHLPVPLVPVRLPWWKRPWWKRRRFIVAVALVVIVAVVVPLGVVLGGRRGSDGQDATPEAGADKGSSGGNTSTPGPFQPARAGSPLAATAMRKLDGGLDMRLFFLDGENRLASARCETSRPLGNKESCWEMERSFASYSERDSEIAASNIVWKTMRPQSQLFYTGSGTRMLGVNFNDNRNPRIIADSIDDMEWTTGPVSALASYWPWVAYQDPSGALMEIRHNPADVVDPDIIWGTVRINVTALAGSRLAMVPVSSLPSQATGTKGVYALFYQGVDMRLSVVSVQHVSNVNSTYPLSFPPNSFPAIDVLDKAAIAAFSTARPNDADGRVDAYVLYVDGSNNINVVYTEFTDAVGSWKTVQPAALREVDVGTSIACVTMAMSGDDERGRVVPLEPVSDGNACYFQKGRVLMEAKMKSPSEWSVQSVVIAKV